MNICIERNYNYQMLYPYPNFRSCIYSNCRTYTLFSDLRYMTFTPKSHYIICRCPRLSQINVSREYFSRVKTGVTSKQQKPFAFLPLLFICINIETQIRQQISTFKDSQRLKSVPSDNKLFCCRIDFVRSDRIY